MVYALVLINTELGAERRVLEQIKAVSGVEEAHALYGVYDIVAKLKADSFSQLKDTIKFGIKRIPEALSFLTLLSGYEGKEDGAPVSGQNFGLIGNEEKYVKPVLQL